MSGYLLVKRSQGVSKCWRKEWCTLRPCPLRAGFVVLATSSWQTEIPSTGVVVRLAKGHSFAVMASRRSSAKPLLCLAGRTETEAQLWMLRIRTMLRGKHLAEKLYYEENCFSISLVDNEQSNAWGLNGLYGLLSVDSKGFIVCDFNDNNSRTNFDFNYVTSIDYLQCDTSPVDRERILVIKTNKNFKYGSGCIQLFCLNGNILKTVLDHYFDLYKSTMFRRTSKGMNSSERTGDNGSSGKMTQSQSPLQCYANFDSKDDKKMISEKNNEQFVKNCEEIYEEIVELPTKCDDVIYEPVGFLNSSADDGDIPPPLPERQYLKNASLKKANNIRESIYDKPVVRKHEEQRSVNIINVAIDSFRNRLKSESHLLKRKNVNSPKVRKSKSPDKKTQRTRSDSGESSEADSEDFNVRELRKSLWRHGHSKSVEAIDSVDFKHYGFSFESVGFDLTPTKSEEVLDSHRTFQKYGFHFGDEYKFDSSYGWQSESCDENVQDLSLLCTEVRCDYPDEVVDLILQGKSNLAERRIKQLNAEETYVPMSPNTLASLCRSENLNSPQKCNAVLDENHYLVMNNRDSS